MKTLESFVESHNLDVYPITIAKYLINKKRFLDFFNRIFNREKLEYSFNSDYTMCEFCKQSQKEGKGKYCQKHNSSNRILIDLFEQDNLILHDIDNNIYFYKNEIFKYINGRLIIIYCPHSKLISGEITWDKIKKTISFCIETNNFDEQTLKDKSIDFSLNELFKYSWTCWFNNIFSYKLIPHENEYMECSLVPNK